MKVCIIVRINGYHRQNFKVCSSREIAEKHLEDFLKSINNLNDERNPAWIEEFDLIGEECNLIKQWENCADDLVDYAREFVENLSTWGKGYNRYDSEIKQAEDAIEKYIKLKK